MAYLTDPGYPAGTDESLIDRPDGANPTDEQCIEAFFEMGTDVVMDTFTNEICKFSDEDQWDIINTLVYGHPLSPSVAAKFYVLASSIKRDDVIEAMEDDL